MTEDSLTVNVPVSSPGWPLVDHILKNLNVELSICLMWRIGFSMSQNNVFTVAESHLWFDICLLVESGLTHISFLSSFSYSEQILPFFFICVAESLTFVDDKAYVCVVLIFSHPTSSFTSSRWSALWHTIKPQPLMSHFCKFACFLCWSTSYFHYLYNAFSIDAAGAAVAKLSDFLFLL